jgi:pimeloyl-ACP methyl ester carboxylesterase
MNWLESAVHTSDGLRLRGYRTATGTGRPPVLLVHGFTDNARYWQRTAEALSAEWEVAAYDARGHGQSDRAGSRFGWPELISDLVAVIRGLGLDRPALIGHSLGAATISRATAQHHGLARCAILEDPPWRDEPPAGTPEEMAARSEQRRAYNENWRQWVDGLQAGTRESGLAQIYAHSPDWSAIDANLSLDARRQVEASLVDRIPSGWTDWRATMGQIDCPILLLLGDRADRGTFVTLDQAREAEGIWRQGRWVQVRGAGHAIRFDQFEQYIEAVTSFLREWT